MALVVGESCQLCRLSLTQRLCGRHRFCRSLGCSCLVPVEMRASALERFLEIGRWNPRGKVHTVIRHLCDAGMWNHSPAGSGNRAPQTVAGISLSKQRPTPFSTAFHAGRPDRPRAVAGRTT